LQTATSAFLRVDLPLLFKRDDFLLYTDCDIIFLRDPQLEMVRPEYFSCAPERVRGDRVHFNSGVMVMNLKALAANHAVFCEYIRQNYAKLVAFDQGAVPEVLGGAGVLVPDKDPYALAAAIAALLRDTHRRHAVIEAGRQRLAALELPTAAERFVDLLVPLTTAAPLTP